METPTRWNEDDVDAEDGVSEPGVEAVEARHLQRGVKHSSLKATHRSEMRRRKTFESHR